MRGFKKALIERALGAEMSHHLDYSPGADKPAQATKLIWLALRNITTDWGRAANNWKSAMNQFAILYDDRFTKATL